MANSGGKVAARKSNSAHRRAFHNQPKPPRKMNPVQRWRMAVNSLDRVRYYCKQLNTKRPPHMDDVAEFIRRVYQSVGMNW